MSQSLNSVIESLNTLTLEEKHQLWQILEKALFQSEPAIQEFMQLSQSGRSLDFLYNEPDLYTLADGEILIDKIVTTVKE